MIEWETAHERNKTDKVRALTTLAATSRRGARVSRVLYWIRRKAGPPKELTDLSFIHFARTALIDRPDGAYLYFESNFNGSFDAYIEAFSYVAGIHMRFIWLTAAGFPGPTPATRFKEYIRRHDFEASHFYCAYRDSTATEVSAALALQKRLRALAKHARDADPAEFAEGWARLQEPISRPRQLGSRLRGLLPRDPNVARDGQAYGLTVITPVPHDELAALRKALEAWPRDGASPFVDAPRTHVARLVLLDGFPYEEAPQLLFSAVVDGDPRSYLRELCDAAPDLVDEAWGPCPGAPWPTSRDSDLFATWMLRHQVQTRTFFAPYGEATVGDVQCALDLKRRVRELASRPAIQGRPSALQRAFAAELVDPGTGRLR